MKTTRIGFMILGLLLLMVSAASAVRPDRPPIKDSIEKGIQKRELNSLRKLTLADLLESEERLQQGLIGLNGKAAERIIRRLNRKLAPANSSVRTLKTQEDKLGNQHIRLQQYYRDIPVVGTDIVIHVNTSNEIYAVGGSIGEALNTTIQASMAMESAQSLVKEDLQLASDNQPMKPPRLVIYDNTLAYEFLLPGEDPDIWKCYANAHTGEILYRENQVVHAAPVGGSAATVQGNRLAGEDGSVVQTEGWLDDTRVYFFHNTTNKWGVYDQDAFDWEQNAGSDWAALDAAAVSLGHNMEIVQDYVATVLQWDSFDDAGAFATAYAHEGTNYVNAYWDGTALHFGDGDGVTADPLTVLDIAAHEFGHAITDYSSDLVYSYESGALNESYSDILGALVEFYAQADGRSAYPAGNDGEADWLMGEDSWVSDEALRDLRDPGRFGQPSYYLGTNWYTGSGDNGGVHTNSGVQNFAFYLLSEGGSGSNDGHPYNISGLGIEAAGEIAMYANMYLLTSSSQYRDARDAWVLAATTLGYDVATVEDVWTACGVLPLESHLTITPLALNFGNVGVGASRTLTLSFVNDGADPTVVSALNFTNAKFSTSQTTPFSLPGGGTSEVEIVFTPDVLGGESGDLIVTSDADDNPSITVSMTGNGTDPAVISVSPNTISESVVVGETVDVSLTVTNDGVADLVFTPNGSQDPAPTFNRNIEVSGTPQLVESNNNESIASALPESQDSPSLSPTPLTGHTPAASDLAVLFLHTSSSFSQFQTELSVLPSVETLDAVNITITTPNVAYLANYDVVILATNSTLASSATLGDNLADYVDAGGRVVLMNLTNGGTGGWVLTGRIMTPDYAPLATTSYSFATVTSATLENHPINEGITSISTGYHTQNTVPQGDGISLGTYNTGGYLTGAYNPNKPIVALNIFPHSSYWGGDVMLMVSNTMDYLMSNTWLQVAGAGDPITLTQGQSAQVTVTLSAADITGGTYTGTVDFTHNDPLETQPLQIPVTFDVDGFRRLSVTPGALDFGNTWIGTSPTITLTLENTGDEVTTINGLASDNAEFSTTATTPLSVPAFGSVDVEVSFSPVDLGAETGTFTITSDAEDNPTLAVTLTGTGTAPPDISLDPTSLEVTLTTGENASETVALNNVGGDNLSFEVLAAGGGQIVVNEFSSSPDFIELWNRGSDQDMTGWTIQWVDNTSTSGTFTFPSGYVFPSGKRLLLRENSGTSNDSTFYWGSNIGWVTSSVVAVWVTDDAGNGVDFVRTSTSTTSPPAGTGWTGTGVSFSSVNASRNTNEDTDDAVDWTNSTSNSEYLLNPGQTDDGVFPDWLSASPVTGEVVAGGTQNLAFNIDATGLLGGNYTQDVVIASNDPDEPEVILPVTLNVDGVRSLTVTPTSLDFGNVWTGTQGTAQVVLENSGSEATTVSDITSDNGVFTVSQTLPLTLEPFATQTVNVFFDPVALGTETGTLTITSDAEDNPTLAVALAGTGISPPEVSLTPASLQFNLVSGETETLPVTLSNPGGADLIWNFDNITGQIISNEIYEVIPGVQQRAYTANHDISCTNWSDAGNDAFDGFGNPVVGVGGVNQSICMSEGTSSYAINGYQIQVRNDFAENHVYRMLIEPDPSETATRSDIRVFLTGNMGSDGGETNYTDTVIIGSHTVTFYVNEINFPNNDPRVVFLIVPSDPAHQGNVTYWKPSSGYVSMEALNISLPAAVYIIPSYFDLADIKAWLHLELDVQGPQWVNISPTSGVTPAGGSSQIDFTANASNLTSGTYQDAIQMVHNAPGSQSPLDVPLELTVQGIRRLSVNPTQIEFGNVWVGSDVTIQLTLENTGSDATTISDITSDNSVFSTTEALPLTIPPFSSLTLDVFFTPASLGAESGNLAITSDAEDNPTLAVALAGTGTSPPDIDLTPSSLQLTLNAGESSLETVTMSNLGGDDLSFDINSLAGGQIVVNEFCNNPDFIELWNRGPDQDMTGWTLQWVDNTSTSGTFTFPSGYVFPSGKRVVLRENTGSADDTTFYWGSNIGWVGSSIVAVWVADDQNNGVDFVRTTSSSTTPPAGTQWTGTGVSFSLVSASRNTNDDTDDPSDWANTSTPSEFQLNPGQSEGAVMPPWLSVTPLSGTVPPSGNQSLDLDINTAGMFGGIYNEALTIASNDPNEIEVIFPIELTVVGVKQLSASPTSFDFGDVWVGLQSQTTITLTNTGSEVTTISSISSNNGEFTTDAVLPLAVDPQQSVAFEVFFTPADLGTEAGTITITSDAADNPSLSVTLTGTGTEGPQAQISPDALTFNLSPADAPLDLTSVLSNLGGDILSWQITSVQETGSPLFSGIQAPALPAISLDKIYNEENYQHPFVPNEIIVALKEDASHFADQNSLQSLNINNIRELAMAKNPRTGLRAHSGRTLLLIELNGDNPEVVLEGITALQEDANVAYAEPNYLYQLVGIPNDASFSQLYGMHNTGQTGGTADADIDAPEAWDRHTGNKNLVLGVIDTGIDYNHPDLMDNMWVNTAEAQGTSGVDDDGNGYVDDVYGYDFINDEGDPWDDHYHGTHVAGTIGGVGNNGAGVAGVAWTASMAALKIFNSGGSTTSAAILNAVDYSNAMGMKITSNSWGGGAFSQSLMDLIAEAQGLGHLFVAAAGNSNNNNDASPHYPSSYELDNIIAVAATDHNDGKASFSSYGATSVDLGAPGVNTYSCEPGGGYQSLSGTSMATPHVSGAAHLVWTLNPSLSWEQVKDAILNSVDLVPSMNGITLTGGRLNANKALDEAGPAWLSAAPLTPGTLDPGNTENLTVTVDPSGLLAGTWEGVVTVVSDDPVNPQLDISVTANIAGCKSLTASPTSLDFSDVYTGTSSNLTVTATNDCNDATTISAISFDAGDVSHSAVLPLAVPAFSSTTFDVIWSPTSPGGFSATTSITTDADTDPVKSVSLLGNAVLPPDLNVTPASITRTQLIDEVHVEPVTISNTGGSTLEWTLSESAAWLTTSLLSGTLAPGASEVVDVTLDATGLGESVYTATININHNIPGTAPFSLPVQMNVVSCAGDILIGFNETSFEEVLNAGETSTQTLTVDNGGSCPLTLSGAIREQSVMSASTGVQLPDSLVESLRVDNPASTYSNAFIPVETQESYFINVNPEAGNNVLIFRNNLPWGYNFNQPILESLGATVSIASSSEMATLDLSPFDVILIPSQQTTAFYNTYIANLSRFETFLNEGGNLEFHAATYTSYRVPSLPFPGGMETLPTSNLEPNNYPADPSHPILAGAASVLQGSNANHEAFTNLPPEALSIVENSSGQPTVVQYQVGAGVLVVSGMTWEFGYNSGWTSADPLLPNALGHILTASGGPQWISMEPLSAAVPAGGTQDFDLAFDATGLLNGIYTATIDLTHNAGNESSPFPIALQLTVQGGLVTASRVLQAGAAAQRVSSGTTYHLWNITVGGNTRGLTQGTRYKLRLK